MFIFQGVLISGSSSQSTNEIESTLWLGMAPPDGHVCGPQSPLDVDIDGHHERYILYLLDICNAYDYAYDHI